MGHFRFLCLPGSLMIQFENFTPGATNLLSLYIIYNNTNQKRTHSPYLFILFVLVWFFLIELFQLLQSFSSSVCFSLISEISSEYSIFVRDLSSSVIFTIGS